MSYPYITSIITHDTLDKLEAERHQQRKKFGSYPIASNDAMIRIIGEEFGEICKSINQAKPLSETTKEVIQLAAVCIAWLDNDLHDGDA